MCGARAARFVRDLLQERGEALRVELLLLIGEDLRAELVPGGGRVSGIQIARVRIDGNEVEDRQSVVDLFARRGDRWVMTWACSVATPTP